MQSRHQCDSKSPTCLKNHRASFSLSPSLAEARAVQTSSERPRADVLLLHHALEACAHLSLTRSNKFPPLASSITIPRYSCALPRA